MGCTYDQQGCSDTHGLIGCAATHTVLQHTSSATSLSHPLASGTPGLGAGGGTHKDRKLQQEPVRECGSIFSPPPHSPPFHPHSYPPAPCTPTLPTLPPPTPTPTHQRLPVRLEQGGLAPEPALVHGVAQAALVAKLLRRRMKGGLPSLALCRGHVHMHGLIHTQGAGPACTARGHMCTSMIYIRCRTCLRQMDPACARFAVLPALPCTRSSTLPALPEPEIESPRCPAQVYTRQNAPP